VRKALLAPIRPSIGVERAYQKRLDHWIKAMQADIMATIEQVYGEHTASSEREFSVNVALDASPAENLAEALRNLRRKWTDGFDRLAPDLAAYFATAAKDRTDMQLRAALRKAGFTIKFSWTPEVRDITQAAIAENVNLIKSIPSQHFTQIEGDVMRAVQVGGKLGPLADKLEHQYGVTRRRAALIARDQNRKANAVIEKSRQQELGITQAIWKHSAGGKHPRPSHVKAGRDGVVYNVADGWYDPDAKMRVWPGTLINCRCWCRSVLPGLAGYQKAA